MLRSFPARLTYNDVLPGFESADVMAVMEIIHLPQDGCHAGHKNSLEWEKKPKYWVIFLG